MKQLFLLFFLYPFLGIDAQELMPGGVKGACLWEITEFSKNDLANWKSRIEVRPDSMKQITGSGKLLNNNPALLIDGGKKNFSLNLGKLEAFTFFTVCQENDTLEKAILSLENDTAPEMVLTNNRLAAMDNFRYASFGSTPVHIPKIYSYTQNKPVNGDQVAKRLQFGLPPRGLTLPVSLYKGLVPEMILFGRPLSYLERQKVESYLALKYGITLNQDFPVSYLNSKGQIIWDADRNMSYNNNITGIGRDEFSGLNQKVSENCESPGLFKISVLHDMADQTFIVLGDNGGEPRFYERETINRLGKEWKASSFQSKSDTVLLEMDKLSLKQIRPLKEGNTFWLMIDRSATGKYPFKQTDFVKCSNLPNSKVQFNPVLFDADQSGDDIFTLITAPEFFSRSTVISSSCTSENVGALFLDIAGGQPPFLVTLENPDLHFRSQVMIKDKYYSFTGLNQGSYQLTLVDANKTSFTKKILVSNNQNWDGKVSSSYKLEDEMPLSLDASAGITANRYDYSWVTPDGVIIQNKIIQITQSGRYLLSITDENNCNSLREINVAKAQSTSIKNVELYPNPTKGNFITRVELRNPADVTVSIMDMTGRTLKQTVFKNDYYYMLTDKMNKPGTYFLTIATSKEKETLKLVVQ